MPSPSRGSHISVIPTKLYGAGPQGKTAVMGGYEGSVVFAKLRSIASTTPVVVSMTIEPDASDTPGSVGPDGCALAVATRLKFTISSAKAFEAMSSRTATKPVATA